MEKVSQEKLVELLKQKGDATYQELSKLTGYHPKSLIRIHSNLKKNNYLLERKKDIKNEVVAEYLKSNNKSYQDFYNHSLKHQMSYSALCKILKNTKLKEEIVFIRKVKRKGNYYFEIIDYQTESLLFCLDSLKNDKKSFKKIFYLVLNHFGAPNHISFINFYQSIPSEIQNLLNKYHVKVLPFKSIYRNVLNHISKNNKKVHYRKVKIDNEDFYDSKIRKTIDDNIIQFKNTRYVIKTNNKIKKNEKVMLFYNEEIDDLFIKFKGNTYQLSIYKNVESKKGNSKYN